MFAKCYFTDSFLESYISEKKEAHSLFEEKTDEIEGKLDIIQSPRSKHWERMRVIPLQYYQRTILEVVEIRKDILDIPCAAFWDTHVSAPSKEMKGEG